MYTMKSWCCCCLGWKGLNKFPMLGLFNDCIIGKWEGCQLGRRRRFIEQGICIIDMKVDY